MKIAKQNIQNAQSVLNIVEAGQQKSLEVVQEMREKMLMNDGLNFNYRIKGSQF